MILYFLFIGGARCEACFNNFRSMIELQEHVDSSHRITGKHFSSVCHFKMKTHKNPNTSDGVLQ